MLLSIALTTLLALAVSAQPNPTEPGPNDVYREGQDCNIKWVVDSSAKWKVMNIELMTGPNLNQVHLSTVGSVDATTLTTYSYKCPDVTLNAPIYFYKFTSPGAPNAPLFTTRFTIAGPGGEVVPAPNKTQPGSNEPIPWGTGSLTNPADGTPPPASTSVGTAPTTVTTTTASTGLPTLLPTTTTTTTSVPPLNTLAPPPNSNATTVVTTSTSTPSPTGNAASSNVALKSSFAIIPLLSLLFLQ